MTDALRAAALSLLRSTQSIVPGFAALDGSDGTSLSALLSAKETRLLALHDELQQKTLQKRILEAQKAAEDATQGASAASVDELEKRLVDAKAQRELKDAVVASALVTKPVLRTIHDAGATSARERALLPLLHRRDTLSLTHANLSHVLATLSEALTDAEMAYHAAVARNRELAGRLLDAAAARKEEVRARRGDEWELARRELRETRARWDVVRGVVQAVVVGSGVDWAGDERLRGVVLACGEEV